MAVASPAAGHAFIFILLWLFCCQPFAIAIVEAYPLAFPEPNSSSAPLVSTRPQEELNLIIRRSATISVDSNGNVTVIDSNTLQPIPQGPATDGAGIGFSLPALLWLGFCGIVGLPLLVTGIRGWRMTTGASVGIGSLVCAWAAIINSVDQTGVADLPLTLICFGIFLVGFAIGCFEFARIGATVLITLLGGFAFGIRILLIKQGLLFSSTSLFAVDWSIATVCAILFAVVTIWSQRIAILLGVTSVGSFLSSLGIDLVLNKQAGLSRGLRFLFDRNSNHLSDILTNGYHPTLMTRIIILVSLALIPIASFAQHKIFKAPFNRNPRDDGIIGDDESPGLWDGPASGKFKSKSRFSM